MMFTRHYGAPPPEILVVFRDGGTGKPQHGKVVAWIATQRYINGALEAAAVVLLLDGTFVEAGLHELAEEQS